jgi:dihydroorotate dehydrogenase
MFRLLHRLLFFLPPELAHRLAMCGLRVAQWCVYRFFPAAHQRPRLQIHVPAMPRLFPGRLGLAAGFDKGAEAFAILQRLGFDFVEVGTVTPEPQAGNPRPRLWRHPPDALVNHMGFNNPGLEVFERHLARYRADLRKPLLANIGKGRSTPNENALDDYRRGFTALEKWVDGFVVNLSSPNTPGLRDLQNTAFLEAIAPLVPTERPVWIKLAPDLSDTELSALCEMIRREPRFSGVVLTNTSRHLAELRQAPQGGLSGRPLLERALECVGLARSILSSKKAIVGVGGVFSGDDALRMRRAGADLIEIYTGFVYRGFSLVREIQQALPD